MCVGRKHGRLGISWPGTSGGCKMGDALSAGSRLCDLGRWGGTLYWWYSGCWNDAAWLIPFGVILGAVAAAIEWYTSGLSGTFGSGNLVGRDISPGVLDLLDVLLGSYLLLSKNWPLDGRIVPALLQFRWNAPWVKHDTVMRLVILYETEVASHFLALVSECYSSLQLIQMLVHSCVKMCPITFFPDCKDLFGMSWGGVR